MISEGDPQFLDAQVRWLTRCSSLIVRHGVAEEVWFLVASDRSEGAVSDASFVAEVAAAYASGAVERVRVGAGARANGAIDAIRRGRGLRPLRVGRFHLAARYFPRAIDELVDDLTQTTSDAFTEGGGIYGYLTIDYGATDTTPYEYVMGQFPAWLTDEGLARVRGYYPRNWLSAPRAARLGGPEAVVAEAPATAAQILEDGESVFLAIGEAVGEISDEMLRSMRDYLEPLLNKDQIPDLFSALPEVLQDSWPRLVLEGRFDDPAE